MHLMSSDGVSTVITICAQTALSTAHFYIPFSAPVLLLTMPCPHVCCGRLGMHNISQHALQVIELDHDFGDTFGGVLTNSEGCMTALWANFNEQAGNDDMEEYCRGIAISIIKPWLQQVMMS